MKKLKLALDDLAVDSFRVTDESPRRGTVPGHMPPPPTAWSACVSDCDSCYATCASCAWTCAASCYATQCDHTCNGAYTCNEPCDVTPKLPC